MGLLHLRRGDIHQATLALEHALEVCQGVDSSEAVAVGNLNFVEKMKSEKKAGGAWRTDSFDLSGDRVGIQNRKSKIDWAKLTGDKLRAKMRL
jgi:hypothetical protein